MEQIFLNAKSVFTFSAGALHLSALFHQKASQHAYKFRPFLSHERLTYVMNNSYFQWFSKRAEDEDPPLIIIKTAENRNKPVSASDKREIQISPGGDEKSWKWILQDVVLQEESEL